MENQYLDVFLVEAKEHIQNLNENLLSLESNPDSNILDEIFRSCHTLKGMAGTMGFSRITSISHEMENLLSDLRSGKSAVTPDIIDALLQCIDVLEELINDIEENSEEKDRDIDSILSRLKKDNVKDRGVSRPNEVSNRNYSLNEFEKHLIREAQNNKMKVWQINVKIDENCLLKSARAYLVYKTLEEFGDIIKTIPTVQEIEDEKFKQDFSIYIITKAEKEKIAEALNKISELKAVHIDDVDSSETSQHKTMQREPQVAAASDISIASNTSIKEKNKLVKKTNRTIRVDIDRLDTFMNLVSELIIIKTRLEDIDKSNTNQQGKEAIEYLERITSSLHDAVMKLRMVPVENVFNRFPRVVHDLARELNKEMELIIEGAETELDKTVIDEIGDPLIHLIRNSADHGIEAPEERVKKGKNPKGTIKLKAYHDGNNVVIEVTDDGRGIDFDKVVEKAIDRGLVAPNGTSKLSDEEIISLLFKPGFSTKEKITDVSGRGVGLDVVKTKIESFGGTIEVNSKKDLGTRFLIRLPLTLAIIQALMVEVSGEKYAIPLNSIKETVMIQKEDIKTIQKSKVLLLRGNVIPIIRLAELLKLHKSIDDGEDLILVIVKKGERYVGLVVDELIGQQEIVIKSLGKYLKDLKYIAGATILGDGRVALILDINNLVK